MAARTFVVKIPPKEDNVTSYLTIVYLHEGTMVIDINLALISRIFSHHAVPAACKPDTVECGWTGTALISA